MGTNLSGFCAADAAVCRNRPGAQPTQATPAQAAANSYGQTIGNTLYRLAAFVGCKAICPALPTIGVAIAEAIGVPADISITPTIAIEAAVLGRLVGEFVQGEICSTCR